MKMTLPRRSRWTLDSLMWLFTRLSGLALVLTAVVAMAGALYLGARLHVDLPTLMRWTFFPNPNHVVNSNIPDVAQGWTSGFWQAIQALVVVFGGTHGFNGLRVVMEDYVRAPRARAVLRWIIGALWVAVTAAGIGIVLSN
jgi:succinate dehydrogenase hydrophobic anchor subunit